MQTSVHAIKEYYDNNTKLFLRYGEDANTMSIHQPLWEGKDLQQAINYSNKLILTALNDYAAQNNKTEINVLDLGCGVGSSLFYLAQHCELKINLYGVSISATQVKIAKERSSEMGLEQECHFIESDFHHLSEEIPEIDLAFSIEAFVHAQDANLFFQQTSNKLVKNGKLILIDDFLVNNIDEKPLDNKFKKEIQNFKYGWMLGSLLSINTIQSISSKASFILEAEKDLTLLLKINRIRDRFIRLYVKMATGLFKNTPYLKSLIGGDSRQFCLEKGLVQYKMIVFSKENTKTGVKYK